ncbi:Efk-1 [Aphelenchoides besseyi]|nr:Efk-1 [Aphelenchoides besseyi]
MSKSNAADAAESVDSSYSVLGTEIVSWMQESIASVTSGWRRASPTPQMLREQNKRFRTINADAGLSYRDAKTKEEMNKRRRKAVEIRNKQLAKTIKKIADARNVDLCFVVDATGSMTSHIAGVKNSIRGIVADLVKKQEANKKNGQSVVNRLRLAFVAYRDYDYPEQYKVLSFTTSVDEFYNFCTEITLPIDNTCNDIPEDVLGGLNKALNLNWSETDNTKVIFHICDQPAHGREFHNDGYMWGDNYPDGDPSGLTAKGIFEQIDAKGIDYYFGKITDDTNTMIRRFSCFFRYSIDQFDIKNVDAIASSVYSAVSKSVGNSLHKTHSAKLTKRPEREYKLDSTMPSWTQCIEQVGKFITYKLPNSIEDVVNDVPLDRERPEAARVQMALNPFAKGGERIAYYGRDLLTGEEIVLKEYRHEVPAVDSAHRHELANQLQTVASYFASWFMADCEEKFKAEELPATIDFLMIKTLALGLATNPRYMSCEQCLDANARYLRFTNNWDFIMKETDVEKNDISLDLLHFVVCFSHWCYEVTGGKLMVVDLQGTLKSNPSGRPTILLTDPAIHSEDRTRFGAMNLSRLGMMFFLENHKCNRFCKGLNLHEVDLDTVLTA